MQHPRQRRGLIPPWLERMLEPQPQADLKTKDLTELIVWGFLLVFILTVGTLDPFKLSARVNITLAEMFNHAFADTILEVGKPYREKGDLSGVNVPVSVVLIEDDDDALAPMGNVRLDPDAPCYAAEDAGPGTPEPPGDAPPHSLLLYAAVLDRVLAYKPAAILLDVQFIKDRSGETYGLSAMASVLRKAQQLHVPVFTGMALSKNTPVNAKAEGIDAALYKCTGDYLIKTSIQRSTSFLDRGSYPVAWRADDVEGDPVFFTAAASIYRHLCESGAARDRLPARFRPEPHQGLCAGRGVIDDARDVLGKHHQIDMMWSNRTAETQVENTACRRMPRLKERMKALFADGALDVESCRQPPTLTAKHLFTEEGNIDAWRRDAFADRVVIIGLESRKSPDMLESPYGFDVEGVYWHATALHNLLFFHSDYKRRGGTLMSGALYLAFFLTVVLASLINKLHYESGFDRAAEGSLPRGIIFSLMHGLKGFFLGLCIAVLFCSFSWYLLDQGPQSWVGFLVLGLFAPPTVRRILARLRDETSAPAEPTQPSLNEEKP